MFACASTRVGSVHAANVEHNTNKRRQVKYFMAAGRFAGKRHRANPHSLSCGTRAI
jgi:hypothetical protein